MHFLLAAALLAAPVVEADPICADIQRLSTAVAEPAAYAALRESDFVPRLLTDCRRLTVGYSCRQMLLPSDITQETMAKRIMACLPGATIAPGRSWPNLKRAIVTGGGLVFELEESRAQLAQVGRTLSIDIKPGRSRRR